MKHIICVYIELFGVFWYSGANLLVGWVEVWGCAASMSQGDIVVASASTVVFNRREKKKKPSQI